MPSRCGSMGRGLGVVAAGVMLFLQAPVQSAESTAGSRNRGRAGADISGNAPDAPVFANGQLLALVTPSQGNELDGEKVEFRLRISTSLDQSTLEVSLNGNRIESKFHESACTSTYCDETAEVTDADGLENGKNGLTATAHGSGGMGDSAHVRFDWYAGAHTQAAGSVAPTVAFETIKAGGGSPWIRIGGEPFPGVSQTCLGHTMQVLVFDRYQLTERDFRCFDDAASLSGFLRQLTKRDLVVAGTVSLTRTAFPGLNTTAIGGTNFGDAGEFPPMRYPMWYMIVGVGGAPAGQAYETFSVQTTPGQTLYYEPTVRGMLSEDSTSAYNFHSSERRVFEVIPGDRVSTVEIGDQKYTSGPGADGFWVLKIDRVLLQPIDARSRKSDLPCEYNAKLNVACGKFFPTGSADAGIASRAINEMASYLSENQYRRQLLFITSVGTPLSTRARPNEALFRAMDALGGSGYVLMQLANTPLKNQTYTVVSAHDHGFHTSLLGRTAFSSSILTQQSQTGRLRGLLIQNNFSLFGPMESVQDDSQGDTKGRHVDFSFEKIVMEKPEPWPYSGSPGHQAAYRALSFKLLHDYLRNPAGDHLYDIRYYYTGSQNNTIANGVTNPADVAYPGESCGCTKKEWEETADQLAAEKGYLRQLINFFGNGAASGGMGGVISGNSSNVTLSLLEAATAVQSSALEPDPNAPLSVNGLGVLLLATNVVQIGQLLGGPYAIPLGLVSGILSMADTLSGGLQPGGLPSPVYTFTTTLNQLTRSRIRYLENMQIAFNTSLDSIYSDWPKLEAAGRKVVDTSGGWYYDTQSSYGRDVGPTLNKAMQRDAYLQLMRPYYGVDYWPNIRFSSFDQIGTYETIFDKYYCQAFYRNNKTPAEAASTFATPSGNDILVIAGAITSNRDSRVKEKNVPVSLVKLLFGSGTSDLNMPRQTFLGPFGPLSRRDGPRYNRNNTFCDVK